MRQHRFLTLLLSGVLLLSACGKPSAPKQTASQAETSTYAPQTEPATTTAGGAEETTEITTAQTEVLPAPIKAEKTLPTPYIDIEFSADGTAWDAMKHVECAMPAKSLGRVENSAVSFGGQSYTVPHLHAEKAGGAITLTYKYLALESEVTQLMAGGFTIETFLVNGNRLAANATEQCMANAGQSGGFGLSIKNGRLGFGVYTESSYKVASFAGQYDTENLTHLLGVYDATGKVVKLYINGKLTSSVNAAGMFRPAQQGCHSYIVLGGDIGSGGKTELHATNTRIADFKLYPAALSADEASAAYESAAAKLTGAETAFLLSYRPTDGIPQGSEGALYQNLLESYATVHEPQSGILVTPTVLQWASGDLTSLAAKDERPATVIFDLVQRNGTLYALDTDGRELGTLSDAIEALDSRIIPAFRVNDPAVGTALTAFLAQNRIGDGYFLSENADLLYTLWSASDPVRPILDRTALNEIDAGKLFLESAACGAKAVLLRAEALTQELADALQARSVAVFVTLDSTDTPAIHDAIFRGAQGIVTEDAAAVLDYYKAFTDRTLADPSLIIAHRGDHANCPDNTMRSFISAAASGADIIECDVWMTADGHLVLNHDATTTGYSEVLNCKSATREQLQSLTYMGRNAKEGDKLTFLDEMMAYFAKHDTDMVFYIELKDTRHEVADKVVAMAKQYGMAERVVLLSMNESFDSYIFNTHRVPLMKNSSTVYPRDDLHRALALSCIDLAKLPTVYATQWKNADEGLLRLLRHRGIPYSPWTSGSAADTDKHYALSYASLTTNYPHQSDKYVRYLKVSEDAAGRITVRCVYYDGTVEDVTARAEFVPLSGRLTYQNGMVSGSGAYAFRLRTSLPILTDFVYDIYSESNIR